MDGTAVVACWVGGLVAVYTRGCAVLAEVPHGEGFAGQRDDVPETVELTWVGGFQEGLL